MKIAMRFEGGRELQAALAALKPATAKRTMREVLKDAAEPLRKRMASGAPRSSDAGPHLADNIVISNATKADGISDSEVGIRIGPAKGFIQAFFQEFGTIFHPAQAFARPAADAEIPNLPKEIGRRLWVELAGRGIHRPTQSGAGPTVGGTGGSTL